MDDQNRGVIAMSDQKHRRPTGVTVLFVTQLVLAFVGLMSAYGLLSDPSGDGLELSLDLLENAPVGDFALVGLFFLAFYGILPAVAAFGLWTRPRWTWTDPINKWTGQHWAWTASAALGIILLLWIFVELIFVGLLTGIGLALQIIITLLGLGVLVLVTRPSVRAHLKLEDLQNK